MAEKVFTNRENNTGFGKEDLVFKMHNFPLLNWYVTKSDFFKHLEADT